MPDSDLTPEQMELLSQSENCLGYRFKDFSLLYEAVTHASSSRTRLKSYERLEFLGDSILGFVVCEYLFYEFPTWLEGDLTKIKSVVVSRQTCGRIAQQLGIEGLLVVGKGLGQQGAVPKSLLANSFESLLGAMYLDSDLDTVKAFLVPFVEEEVREAIAGNNSSNYKSELQQYAQKHYGTPPTYVLLGDQGPDHDKSFQIAAKVDQSRYSAAWGKNKKQAEQRAAANALSEIMGGEPPFPSTPES